MSARQSTTTGSPPSSWTRRGPLHGRGAGAGRCAPEAAPRPGAAAGASLVIVDVAPPDVEALPVPLHVLAGQVDPAEEQRCLRVVEKGQRPMVQSALEVLDRQRGSAGLTRVETQRSLAHAGQLPAGCGEVVALCLD